MASKKQSSPIASESSVETTVRELIPSLDLQPWMDRATTMLQERPAVTIGVAVGTGFVLGVTLFSKLGRIVLAGAFGLAAELAMQKARASLSEGNNAQA
ncbi:MAG: hypothetical protein ABI321_00045 [Polyangia bacterium]